MKTEKKNISAIAKQTAGDYDRKRKLITSRLVIGMGTDWKGKVAPAGLRQPGIRRLRSVLRIIKIKPCRNEERWNIHNQIRKR